MPNFRTEPIVVPDVTVVARPGGSDYTALASEILELLPRSIIDILPTAFDHIDYSVGDVSTDMVAYRQWILRLRYPWHSIIDCDHLKRLTLYLVLCFYRDSPITKYRIVARRNDEVIDLAANRYNPSNAIGEYEGLPMLTLIQEMTIMHLAVRLNTMLLEMLPT